MSGWQPISTAPKGDDVIDIAYLDHEGGVVARYPAFWDDDLEAWCSIWPELVDPFEEPDAWRPLGGGS